MEKYTIDFTEVKTVWYFYEAIKKGLKFPDWCGRNPDAIWDMISGYMKYPAIVYIKGVNTLSDEFQEEMEDILRVLTRAVNWYDEGEFEFEIID